MKIGEILFVRPPIQMTVPIEIPYIVLEPISVLDLYIRTKKSLERGNIKYVGELVQYTNSDLLKLKGFGRKQLADVETELNKHGLELGTMVPGLPPRGLLDDYAACRARDKK